jgi:hypothetical protein
MILIRATRRLLKDVRDIVNEPTEPAFPLSEWYANAIPLPLPGRWVVLYTSAESLLTVLVPGRSLTTTVPRFKLRAEQLLRRLGAAPEWIDQHRIHAEQVVFARTADRRVLGTMNDLAFLAQVAAEEAKSFDRLDLDALELQLARTPFSLLNYGYPAGAATALFATSGA